MPKMVSTPMLSWSRNLGVEPMDIVDDDDDDTHTHVRLVET